MSRTMFPHIRQAHPLTYALNLPHHPFRARSSSLGFLARNIHRDELLNTIEAEVRNNIVKLTPAESASFPRDSGARASHGRQLVALSSGVRDLLHDRQTSLLVPDMRVMRVIGRFSRAHAEQSQTPSLKSTDRSGQSAASMPFLAQRALASVSAAPHLGSLSCAGNAQAVSASSAEHAESSLSCLLRLSGGKEG
mmetsp:Transcript_38641/g.124141  ORF Transcript_38641/g.124141 Transcript_38641/m.124141 type:complete len:194 (+) Transcript_38641:128-709(+)